VGRLDSIRVTLTSKVFNSDLGTDVIVTPVTKAASSDGGFTPGDETSGTATTVKGIPYNNSTQNLFKELFGNSKAANGTVIVPYTTTVNIGDKLTWLSQDYYVTNVEDFILGGGVVAKQIITNERS
jgi:LysM repeat protein